MASDECNAGELAKRPEQLPARTSNLPWILGVGGGAIGGVFVGVANYIAFPAGLLLFLAVGAGVGAIAPRIGSLAGLAAPLAVLTNAVWGGGTESEYRMFFLWFPLVGGGIGFIWSLVARRQKRPIAERQTPRREKPDIGVMRQDRMTLATIALVIGPLLGAIGGHLPFFLVGCVVGLVVFLGLTVSALLH